MTRSTAARSLKGGTAAVLALAALLTAAPGHAPAAESAAPPAPAAVTWNDPPSAGGAPTEKADAGTPVKSDTAAASKDTPASTEKDKSGKDKSAKSAKSKSENADAAAETPVAGDEKTEKKDKADKADKSGDDKSKAGKKSATMPKAIVIGKFDVWEAAYFDDHGNKVCYMATAPVSTSSSAPVHGRDKNVLLFITHWPADNEKNSVTVAAGYSYKEGSKAVVNIGTESYALDTGGPGTGADADMSWMKDDSQDDALTKAIQKGDELTVRGTSKRGTTITDTYSLKGSADAYKAITKTCGY